MFGRHILQLSVKVTGSFLRFIIFSSVIELMYHMSCQRYGGTFKSIILKCKYNYSLNNSLIEKISEQYH